MKRVLAVIASVLMLPLAAAGEEPNRAWIVATREDGMIRLEIFARLAKGEKGTYELRAIKDGASGRSVNRQAGSVPRSQGAAVGPLSTSRFSVETGATLDVELVVTTESGSVYEDRVRFAGD